jgi:hypothetical protein
LKVLKSHKLDPCHSKMIFKEVVGDISWKNDIQKLIKGLEVLKAKGITDQTCHILYLNLEKLYTQHKYMHTSSNI